MRTVNRGGTAEFFRPLHISCAEGILLYTLRIKIETRKEINYGNHRLFGAKFKTIRC